MTVRLNARSLSRLWPILFASLVLLVLFAPISSSFNFYDEGFAVVNATRLLDHETPYRDFWSIYPPGQMYILAGAFRLFGISLSVSRCCDTLIRALLVLGIFLISRIITTRPLAYLATLAVTLVLAVPGFYAYAVYPAMAAGIFAIHSALLYARRGSRSWLLASGALNGLAGIIRWDIAIYLALGSSAALFIHEALKAGPLRSTPAGSARAAIATAARPLAVTAGVMVVGYALIGMTSGFDNLWDQVFRFPSTRMRAVRWLAYPEPFRPHVAALSDFWRANTMPMRWLRFYLPPLIFALAWLHYGRALLARRIVPTVPDFGIMTFALCGPLLFLQALNRYDFVHVLPALVAAIVVFAGLLPAAVRPPEGRIRAPAAALLLPAVACVYLLAPIYGVAGTMHRHPWGKPHSALPRAGCASTSPIDEEAILYVQAHTRPDERIYVGNQRHDLLYKSDVGFYFLAARPSATRYSELHPGVANTLPVQREIVRDLEDRGVRVLVLAEITPSDEPNESNESTGVTYLDAYIREHYVVAAVFGRYRILERKP